MSFIGLLRTLEQITRPPRLGHDVDVEDGAAQLAECEAETECLVPEDFNAVCRCAACVAEEQASAVEYDDDPSPAIVQSAPPPTVDGEGPASVRDIQPSPEAGRSPHPVPREQRIGTYCEDYEIDGCSVDVCPVGCYLALKDAALPEDAAAEWIGEAVPVITEVLVDHASVNIFRLYDKRCRCGIALAHMEEWRAHIAPLIAEALAPQPK